MRNAAHQPRAHRTITIDFHNEATYVQLPGFRATKQHIHRGLSAL